MDSKKRLVLLGGGHSQVEVLRRFAKDRPANAALTLISREAFAPYSGMVPGHIAGHYSREACHIDLAPLAAGAGAEFIHDTVTGLDLDSQTVSLKGGATVPYDLLSVNVGSRPGTLDVPGAAAHVIPVKPVDRLLERLKEALLALGTAERPLHAVVIGGGAGGVELILALNQRLQRDYPVAHASGLIHFHLFTASKTILPAHNDKARAAMAAALERNAIQVRCDVRIARVDDRFLRTAGDSAVPYDVVFWATNAEPAPWIQGTGIETDAAGFISVDNALRSLSHPNVFAAGDVATIKEHPRPKSGVFAVRAGPVLAENLRRALQGAPLSEFKPQHQALTIMTTGAKHAVAARGRWSVEGQWVWWWKHVIDTRFMKRYRVPAAKGV